MNSRAWEQIYPEGEWSAKGSFCRGVAVLAFGNLPPPEGTYKCASVYKPIKSGVCCITSVYISVYSIVDCRARGILTTDTEAQRRPGIVYHG